MKASLVAAALIAVACSGSSADVTATSAGPAGATSPEAAVASTLDALRQRDFAAAGAPMSDGQVAMILLAEGGSASEVLEADRAGVARNFWFGFADALGPESLAGLTIVENAAIERFDVRGVGFAVVPISVSGERRLFVVRDDSQGWVVDVVATFAEVLGSRYGTGIDRALKSPEAADLRPVLESQIPSMLAVLEIPGFEDGALQQAMLLGVDLLGG